MATDPFNFIVGQIVATASAEIDDAKKRKIAKEKEICDSMAGFVWLKDWRIAHPNLYLYAKKHKIDYSHLRKTTATDVLRKKNVDQRKRENANMRALKSTIYGEKSEVTFIPTVWKTDHHILVLAKEEKLRGVEFAVFCQKYPGAYSRLGRADKINQLRLIFGLKPHITWTKEKAILVAQRYKGQLEKFKEKESGAFRLLSKYPKEMGNLFKDFIPVVRWTIASALREVEICAANGFVLEDFRQQRSGCFQFLVRQDYLEEIRPHFDKNKCKYKVSDCLVAAKEVAQWGGNRSQMKKTKRGEYHFLLKNKLLHLLDTIFAKGKKSYDGYAPQLVLNTTS